MTPNDRTEPGVCPECKGAGGGASNELCEVCDGTGQQPAQPDYDPIAAVEAVEHYEASAKALDALDSLDAQPESGEVKRYTPNSIANEIMAEDAWHDSLWVRAADHDRLQSTLEAAQQEIAELKEQRRNWLDTDLQAQTLVSIQRELTAAQRDRNAQYDRAQQVSQHNSRLWSEREALRDQLTAAQQRIAALHASLRTYGWHKPECDYMQEELPCTCGFMDAIKGRDIGPLPGGEG